MLFSKFHLVKITTLRQLVMNWFVYGLVGIKSVLKINDYIQYNNNSIVYEYNYFHKLHNKSTELILEIFHFLYILFNSICFYNVFSNSKSKISASALSRSSVHVNPFGLAWRNFLSFQIAPMIEFCIIV